MSSSGALMKTEATISSTAIRQAIRNSGRSRCGQVRTVSSGRLSTRTIDSCLTYASRRKRSVPGTPGGPGSFGPGLRSMTGTFGAWLGAVLSAVALGRFSMVIVSARTSYRTRDAAVLPDPPEVDDHQDGGDQREGNDVHHVEANQGPLVDGDAAQQPEA